MDSICAKCGRPFSNLAGYSNRKNCWRKDCMKLLWKDWRDRKKSRQWIHRGKVA